MYLATLDGEVFTPGTYTIIWTAADVGTNTDKCVFVLIVNEFVGVSELSAENEISIYPNPTTGIFVVNYYAARSYGRLQVKITDISGRTVKQFNLTIQQVDLTNQPCGVYFINFKSDTRTITKKLIIQ